MGKDARRTILFVTHSLHSFIRSDISILSTRFEVLLNIYPWSKKIYTPWFMVKQLWWMLLNIRKVHVIVISFGGYWALVPALMGKLFRRPVIIIVHGTDCAAIPSIGYGMLRKDPLRTICKWSYSLADVIIPVSESLKFVRNTFYEPEDTKECDQGIHQFFPDLNTPIKAIFNGLDPNFWRMKKGELKKNHTFISVFSSPQFFLKGGDLIVNMAERFPNATFFIAGTSPENIQSTWPENVVLLGRLSPEELRRYFAKCTFYFQLSIFEGFGCALCEAMLTECIPIGSSVNMIPEIIGECGYIVEKRNPTELEKVMHKALSSQDNLSIGKMARKRVVENFSFENRKQKLLSLMESYL